MLTNIATLLTLIAHRGLLAGGLIPPPTASMSYFFFEK
jgi:hypothetical protein